MKSIFSRPNYRHRLTEQTIKEIKTNLTKKKMQTRVNWYIRGQVECPHCEYVNEFTDVDEFWTYSKIGENHEQFDEPCEMTCKGCNEKIIVNGSDY